MPYPRKEYFYGGINKNGEIIDVDRNTILGIDNQYADDLRDKIKKLEAVVEEWRPLMIKHGYIVEPKTPEEIMEEQKGLIEKLYDKIEQSEERSAKFAEQVENLTLLFGGINNELTQSRYLSRSGEEQDGLPVKDVRKSDGVKNKPGGTTKLHNESGGLSAEQQT